MRSPRSRNAAPSSPSEDDRCRAGGGVGGVATGDDAARGGSRAGSDGAGLRKLDLFAVAVFQNAHYTAFVRAKDGSDSWTYHDRRSAVAVGPFVNVVARCRAGPMLPYLLFYDALTAASSGA